MTANVPSANSGFPCGLPGDRLIRGSFARWNETSNWTDRDGLPLPATMLVVGYTTVLQMWKNKKAEVISQHPLPDAKQLNDEIPVSEWELDLAGKPTPPWKLTYVIYMVDPKSGSIFTYANNTYGAMLVYSNLEEQVGVMRMLRGEHVFPIVRLEKRPMKTAYGMKTRPHLQPIEWHAGGGGGAKLAVQPPAPQISGPATPATPPAWPPRRSLRQPQPPRQRHRRSPRQRHRRSSTTCNRSNRSRSRNSSPTNCRPGPEPGDKSDKDGRRLKPPVRFRGGCRDRLLGHRDLFSDQPARSRRLHLCE